MSQWHQLRRIGERRRRFPTLAMVLILTAAVAGTNLRAQGAEGFERRAASVEDIVAFAKRNYFAGITVDSVRARQIDRIVRAYSDSLSRIEDIRKRNARLPYRRQALRALLRTDEERQRFDRNVKERRLP